MALTFFCTISVSNGLLYKYFSTTLLLELCSAQYHHIAGGISKKVFDTHLYLSSKSRQSGIFSFPILRHEITQILVLNYKKGKI